MKHKKNQPFFILSLFLLLLNACYQKPISTMSSKNPSLPVETSIATPEIVTSDPNPSMNTPTLASKNNECIPPLETFAYPVSMDSTKPSYPGNGPTMLPSSPWQMVFSPLDLNGSLSILATRFINDHMEIWLAQNSYNYYTADANNKSYQFIVHRSDTKSAKTVSAEVEDSRVYVNKLFVTHDGTLWGQSVWNIKAENTGIPILSKYNDNIEKFELQQSVASIPSARLDSKDIPYWPEVLLDTRDVFWILVHKDAIYSYNPVTEDIERYIDVPDIIFSKAAISTDGSIFFSKQSSNAVVITDEDLYHFIPLMRKLEKISIPLEPWPLFSNILVDHTGRLWLDSIGWREPDGKWYQVQRSPVFITNILWSGLEHRWKTPKILMESSDNRLWFMSDNGLTWLDPKRGEWCWFTTEQSNIVEDSQNNLWMVADNKLYKLDLNP